MRSRWLDALAADPTIEACRAQLRAGHTTEISGLAGATRFLLPLLLTEAPLLFVVARERDVELATADLTLLAREAGRPGDVRALPAPGPLPFRGLPRHPDAMLQRAAALCGASRGRSSATVASPAGLLRPALAPRLLETRIVALRAGDEMTPEILVEALDAAGYRLEDPVTAPGQMARRGGILDLFPPDRERPVRIEFFGDTIESLRAFDIGTQRSAGAIAAIEVLPLSDTQPPRSVLDALESHLIAQFGQTRDVEILVDRLARGSVPDEVADLLPLVPDASVPPWHHLEAASVAATVVVVDPEAVALEAEAFIEHAAEEHARKRVGLSLPPELALVPLAQLHERLAESPAIHVRGLDTDAHGVRIPTQPVRRYAGDLKGLLRDLATNPGTCVIFLGTHGRAERFKDLLRDEQLACGDGTRLHVEVGALGAGFTFPVAGLTVLADGDVFPEEVHLHARERRRSLKGFLSDFRDLKPGDLVVHQDHGIGRFEGLDTIEVAGLAREFLVLAYQGGDKLKVPVEAFDRIQKFTGASAARPALDKLGGGNWEKVRRRVKKAMRDMAAELLRLYAERKARPGHAFTADAPWLREFEESFEYEETPDQAAAIADVAADMASRAPMDRLVCGDVGYGKTEVAMRAAMRAVLDGKQVALLAPTTVLTFQHWKTFRTRFAPFPVAIEMLSRFRSQKEVRDVLARLAAGTVDVVVGTHRLLSKDVAFRDLGLLIVDEEQRFGVAAKERLKQLKTGVDCLTLSATPIPRTLQMGLAGIRDMSVIETPPRDRLAIHTSIVKFSTDVIAAAIRQELARDGQVYVLHDRVESIYALAALVQRLVPEARVAVAHGQMPEKELEKTMLAFVEGRADVLVATTLIENGLDIPRANTLIVNRADRFGLSQLYQLRGRVGRSDRRAFAYLLVPPDTVLSEIARKRLAAIQEFSDLGAGFRIAALDLELRGAGNLLGGDQSGHIEAIGLDLYVKLLEQTVLELKGEAPAEAPRATLQLGLAVRIPESYVPQTHQRMSLYKRLSEARSGDAIEALAIELRDRYGPVPAEAETLLESARLRILAEAASVSQVDRHGAYLHVRFAPPGPPAERLVSAARSLPGAALSPQGVLKWPLGEAASPLTVLDQLLRRLLPDTQVVSSRVAPNLR